jgi:hypothetical protein
VFVVYTCVCENKLKDNTLSNVSNNNFKFFIVIVEF